MSKAVLMAIQPKYCELIASGKKTIEVRKTIPKLGTPFKVYMYCTKGKHEALWWYHDRYYYDTQFPNNRPNKANGKVIGEFTCYDIGEYETEFYPKGQKQVYEAIYQYNEDEEVWEPVLTNDSLQEDQFAEDTCLSIEDFRNYLGAGEIRFYGLCISDVVIYDEPKELTSFYRPCPYEEKDDISCFLCDKSGYRPDNAELDCFYFCEKPPQSWYYVEEVV